jgi:site-specific recombinase XerD
VQQITASPLGTLIESWVLALQARNVSVSTISVYRKSAELLVAHIAADGVTGPEQVEKRHVERFIAHLAETRSASTASVRYRALQQWFAWMTDEEEITANPMARMRPPIVPEQPVPVLEPGEVQALLAACEGKEFADRRDSAIVHLFLDTGVRLAELTGVTLDDVDLSGRTLTVMGKGRRGRTVAFGARTARAVDRYLRARARHKHAELPALWLAERGGAMTSSGVSQVVKRRGEAAGIKGLHPHQLRHTSVHGWLSAGGAEGDAMQLFGWKSRQMLSRYGASAAAERARAAHRRHGLVDRL